MVGLALCRWICPDLVITWLLVFPLLQSLTVKPKKWLLCSWFDDCGADERLDCWSILLEDLAEYGNLRNVEHACVIWNVFFVPNCGPRGRSVLYEQTFEFPSERWPTWANILFLWKDYMLLQLNMILTETFQFGKDLFPRIHTHNKTSRW